MSYIIRFTDPAGATTYWPEGFGFTSHAHAATIDGAERFTDPRKAQQRLNGYVNPPAFWESERRHASLMREHFRGWSYSVENIG